MSKLGSEVNVSGEIVASGLQIQRRSLHHLQTALHFSLNTPTRFLHFKVDFKCEKAENSK